MEKGELRRETKQKVQSLSLQYKILAAKTVKTTLEKNAEFCAAKKILIYHSLPDELSTIEMLNCWRKEKELFLPAVIGDDLAIRKYEFENLSDGAFGIKEPQGDNISPDEIDVIVVPAVAFDCNKNRLGRGKGFYDRLLSKMRGYKIGIAFDVQIADIIPTANHDIKMDCIITENRTI